MPPNNPEFYVLMNEIEFAQYFKEAPNETENIKEDLKTIDNEPNLTIQKCFMITGRIPKDVDTARLRRFRQPWYNKSLEKQHNKLKRLKLVSRKYPEKFEEYLMLRKKFEEELKESREIYEEVRGNISKVQLK